ncbi:MAG: DNA helicase [Sphingomonadales bacterium 28-64-96]|nr:MAG: DNA helicase [Sphingomonadales bacterium 28-64-96]
MEPIASQSSQKGLKQLFDETRRRLVETGTRNRLVHVNRANTRGNVVNIIQQHSDIVFQFLQSGRRMRFRALGVDRGPADPGQAEREGNGYEGGGNPDELLSSNLGPDALQKKLLKIAREARTAEEEQGVSVLFLALGFMTWFEDPSSDKPREAPLILLPVRLERNERSSMFDLLIRDDDLITNLPLQRRLKDDFGLRLPEIDPEEELLPSEYFDAVEAMIADQPRWKVDRDGIQLGFFSFAKLLMYLDLDPARWPDGSLEKHELTRGLLFEGFESEEPLFGPSDRLDDILQPEHIFHVVDADASQACVIEEVRSGRNLVVQGPPGTGKSQTITNIIAAAVHEGRSVLFVAEKMAALSVVHQRLVKQGLGDICLEIHSKTANKKAVLSELAGTLTAAQSIPTAPAAPLALRAVRDELNAVAQSLHQPIGMTEETPFSVLGTQARFIGQNAPTPTFSAGELGSMSRNEETALCRLLDEYATVVASAGPANAHPFAGVTALDLQPLDVARLEPLLSGASRVVLAARDAIDEPMKALTWDGGRALARLPVVEDALNRLSNLPTGGQELAEAILAITDVDRLLEGLEAAARWRTAHDEANQLFIDEAYQSSSATIRGAIAAGTTSFFARWGGAYRSASRELAGLLKGALPKAASERLQLIDRLLGIGTLRKRWSDEELFMAAALGAVWRGERTDFATALAVTAWSKGVRSCPVPLTIEAAVELAADTARLEKFKSAIAAAASEAQVAIDTVVERLGLDRVALFGANGELDLMHAATKLDAMSAASDRYSEWTRLCRLRTKLDDAGLGVLAERIASGELTSEAAQVELRFARAERLWRKAIAGSPTLQSISAKDRDALACEFAKLDRQRLHDNVSAILARHLGQVPRGAQGEMAVIRGEIAKKKRHFPLRKLFQKAPTAIQRIKPVLLMSPISVAQFLAPGTIEFDLLIFDEASQVRPEDALGAIARAKQIVVVGDQKQLPPTSFFDRLVADEGEDEETDEETEALLGGAATVGELESILSLCEARGLSPRMLKWHYRSRDPSLIRVSNREFYRDQLILPPSPLQKDPSYGLIFKRVNGVYDRGGRRDNCIEAETIVARVAEHARLTPDLSLGIVAFSAAQQNCLTELLELARREDAALDAFLREGGVEDVFVKNIENVQGDERDVILISVGYGPSVPGGRLTSMVFGPVNSDGGERRLNVLFTRARVRCEVFASFDPSDIDVTRTSREGPKILKRFLDFAKTGIIDDTFMTGNPADSDFELDVADVINGMGYLADPQVGSVGFKIDIGVRHPDQPGTYILAVECDGATYHSALWARERDRLRQDVLEHLGWRFHRIWSTDWFYSRQTQIQRLRQALEAARAAAAEGVKIEGANTRSVTTQPQVAAAADPAPVAIPEAIERIMPLYQRAQFTVTSSYEPHEAPAYVLTPLVQKIIGAEGPICVEEVARRVASAFGREKAGRRIIDATRQTLMGLRRTDPSLRSGESNEFWFTAEQAADPPVRDRSNEIGATLKASSLSLLEIRAALAIAQEDNAGGIDDDLIRTAARLLGFKRVGSDLRDRLAEGL